MPVLANQASLTPYLEEAGLVLAPVGGDHTDTPTPVGMEPPSLTVVWVVGSAGAGLHPTGIPGGRTTTKIFLRR